MKTTIAKCPRCGKEHELIYATAKPTIKCSHCNQLMERSAATEKKINIYGIVISLACILVLTFGISLLNPDGDNKIFLAFMITLISQQIGTYFVLKFFGFEYIKVEKIK